MWLYLGLVPIVMILLNRSTDMVLKSVGACRKEKKNLGKTVTDNQVFGNNRTRERIVTSTWNTFSARFQASVAVKVRSSML